MIFMAARLGRNLRQVRNWLHPMHYAGRDLTSLTLFLIACQDNVAMLVCLFICYRGNAMRKRFIRLQRPQQLLSF